MNRLSSYNNRPMFRSGPAKRLFLGLCLVFLAASGGTNERPSQKEALISDFEDGTFTNLFGGESGAWNLNMEDLEQGTVPEIVEMAGPRNSSRCLKLVYDVKSILPAQNGFWTKLMNFDAASYDHLEFEVKGDSQAGFDQEFKVALKRYKDKLKDDKIKGTAAVPVTSEWQTVSIPLNRMTGLFDFSNPEVWENPGLSRKDLDEFVVVFQDRQLKKKSGVIYLDNLRFVRTGKPGPTPVASPPRKGIKTPVRLEGVAYAKFLIQRLGGFPERLAVKKEFSSDDRAFLLEVARDTWRFFDQIVDQEHALPLDTVQLGKTKPVDEATWVGDYTNVTNIGLYLMALVSAHDLGFISREVSIARIKKTLDTLDRLETHESGFLYNYYDTTTLERTTYFVSLVDSGWLAAGLYVVKNAFPEVFGERVGTMLSKANFSFFYDSVERQMRHGYYDHLGVYSDYNYGPLYSESRAISFMAIGRGDVPKEHWFLGLVRTFPENYAWQVQPPRNRVERTTLGFTYPGGHYEWNDLKYVPSWGGAAFEALMPVLVLEEKGLAPKGLGLNDVRHVQGQIRYAVEELGLPVWGMSPSSVPEGGYSEFGATPFGTKGYPAGIVTPHASALALEFAPEAVVQNLRRLIKLYDIYGEYGFYDAVNVKTGLVARKYLALDQGMILIAINNYLNDGAIRRRFHADSAMKQAEEILSAEDFGIE
ncbi:MAG: DUF3131 domain-containing protein [Candidatus Omnitrophica bacterium]|nr:DUF3131 domain-containing protein [Candidatus Omnitrophota bacterium]